MIKTMRHTGVVVTDMERSLCFYRGLLGMKVILDREQGGEFLERLIGHRDLRIRSVMLQAPDGNRVELFQFHSHPKKAPETVEASDIGCSHVAFSVDNVDSAYEKLSEVGIHFNYPPQVSPDGYARVAYCHDPDGTIIELVQVLAEE